MFALAMVPELRIKAGPLPGETSQQYWERWRESERNGRGREEGEGRKQLKNARRKGGEAMPSRLQREMWLRNKSEKALADRFFFWTGGGSLRSHQHRFYPLDDQL